MPNVWTQLDEALGWIPPLIITGEAIRNFIASEKDRHGSYLVEHGRFVRGWTSGRETASGRSRPHGAIDIGAPVGTPVYAFRSGVVEYSGLTNGYGHVIIMRHSDGSTALYAHLHERMTPRASVVLGGQQIALTGKTCSRGPDLELCAFRGQPRGRRMGAHLHFSVHGMGRRKLPVSMGPRPRVNTDMEYNFGRNPVPVLARAGVEMWRERWER